MKVVSPVKKAEQETEPVKKVEKPDFEVIDYLKKTYPIPSGCDKLDIRHLWDNKYRLNYWGNTKVAKNSGLYVDTYVILASCMVVTKKEKSGVSSVVLGD